MRSIQAARMLVVALAVVLAACGGSQDPAPTGADDASQPAETDIASEGEAESSADDASSPEDSSAAGEPAGEVIGTVTVDGVEYGITETTLCDPYADEVVDVEIELQGFGTASDGSRVQIDVYVQELAGAPFDDVAWAGPEGVYGNPDDAVVNVSGDQVTGSATLQHAMGDGTTVTVGFDLPLPSSTFACR